MTATNTAGGCRNYPTFVKNPQFVIDLLEDSDGDGKCSCLVALMQKHRRKQKKMGVQDLCIGFSIYKVYQSALRGVKLHIEDLLTNSFLLHLCNDNAQQDLFGTRGPVVLPFLYLSPFTSPGWI